MMEDDEREKSGSEKSNGSPVKEGAVAGAASTEPRGRFPTTVNFRQDSDKTKVYLILSFRGLRSSSGFFGYGRKLENGEILNLQDVFGANEVNLKVRVDNEDDGTSVLFEYKKPVPKKIVPVKSKVEIESNGKIKLTLQKLKGDKSDWTIYNDDFSHPNGS